MERAILANKTTALQRLYNFLIKTVKTILPLASPFSEKINLFTEGRKDTFKILEDKISTEDKVIWFHAASLGEFEQGLPIMEMFREKYPAYKILISFFSPSGYEVKKNTPVADAVVYLPLDTPENVRLFLEAAHPDLAVFIKYEFWPNYLRALKEQNIRTILVSGGFRKDQFFFKKRGAWMKRSLKTFEHFFVQNENSKNLLNSVGFKNVTLSGDTRFDRVSHQIEHNNQLLPIEEFKDGNLCVVAGSTWQADEILLEDFIKSSPENVKFIIAPHQVTKEHINQLRTKFGTAAVLYSEKEEKDLRKYQILIIDNVGILTKIYSYADIAYVGGAAGNTGLHNILEPATFGVPIVIGKNFEKFPEAGQLRKIAGLFSVDSPKELQEVFNKLILNPEFRKKTGSIGEHFINSNTGATKIIEKYFNMKPLKNGV